MASKRRTQVKDQAPARKRGKSLIEQGGGAAPMVADSSAGAVDFIVSEILRGVYEGRFVPGQKLIEGDLTRNFDVGRGTVREALRRLEADGLIESTLHRGARIRGFTRDAVRDLMEVNEQLFGFAASSAAQRLESAREVEGLRRVMEAMTSLVDAGKTFELATLRFTFIRELVALTKNRELSRLLPRLDMSVIRAQFRVAFDRQSDEECVVTYRKIVEAVLARDAAEAARLARRYARNMALSVQKLPDGYFQKPEG